MAIQRYNMNIPIHTVLHVNDLQDYTHFVSSMFSTGIEASEIHFTRSQSTGVYICLNLDNCRREI